MGCEPPANPGVSGELAKLTASGSCGPTPPASGAVDDAEQRADRQRNAVSQPRGELLEAERVHPGFATLVALAVTDQQ
jgi:hypothetical protein